MSASEPGRPISRCPPNCKLRQVLLGRAELQREVDVKCAEAVPYPEIIAYLDQVSPGHGIRNYNLSRHLQHITVPVTSRVIKNEPPMKFSRSDTGQARMDSRVFEQGQQSVEQIAAPTRTTVDKRKATDIAGEMNASIQEIVEEINNLRATDSDAWSPGMQKHFADLQEKKLKYLIAIGSLKTVAGETVLDYKALIKEMGIIDERPAPRKEEKKPDEKKSDGTV